MNPEDDVTGPRHHGIDGDELVDLNIDDQAVPILLESASGDINDPSDLVNLYVTSRDGALVPLSSVVTLTEEGVTTELNRRAQRRAIDNGIERADDYPLQTAVDELRELADEVLPADVSLLFLGEAATLEETSNEVALTYVIALAVIFLVLAAQFEGFTSALVVTLTVPFGVAAAIFAPVVAPYGETEMVGDVWMPMSRDHLLGTDHLGRDMFTRLLYGARNTIAIAFITTMISFVVGIVFAKSPFQLGCVSDVKPVQFFREEDVCEECPAACVTSVLSTGN